MQAIGQVITNLSTASVDLLLGAIGIIVLALVGFVVWALWYRRNHYDQ